MDNRADENSRCRHENHGVPGYNHWTNRQEKTLNMGGMYKRQMPGTPFMPYVMVEDVDKIIAKAEKLGGRIIMPKMKIESVGDTAIIQDTEGNTIGVWKPSMA